jgi:hypothetical protein
MIRRRSIPPIAAVAMMAVAMLPVWRGEAANAAANRWTLALLAAVFVVKAGLFLWMRQRMGGNHLTVFGLALRDFFLALILNGAALALFFGTFAWAAFLGEPLSRWQIATLRAALAASGTLVIATGFGAGWEMSRARTGPKMVVHVPADQDDRVIYEGPDRRRENLGRRRSDRERT